MWYNFGMNMEKMSSSEVVEKKDKKLEQLSPLEIKKNKLRENSNQSHVILQKLGDEKDTLSTEDLIKLHEELLRVTLEGDKLLR